MWVSQHSTTLSSTRATPGETYVYIHGHRITRFNHTRASNRPELSHKRTMVIVLMACHAAFYGRILYGSPYERNAEEDIDSASFNLWPAKYSFSIQQKLQQAQNNVPLLIGPNP